MARDYWRFSWSWMQYWMQYNSNTLATWCKELTHWKRPWCWEGLKAGGEGDGRGWGGWMASLTRWTWVWVNSGSWWQTGKPGVLQSTRLQRVRHNWATELTDRWPESLGLLLCLALSSEVGFHILLWITSKCTILLCKLGWPFKQQGNTLHIRAFSENVYQMLVWLFFFLIKVFHIWGLLVKLSEKKIPLKSLWYGFLKPGVCKILVPPSWMILV